MLCILDGFGWVPDETYGNAIVAAKTPNLDKLFASCPYTTIGASGMDVGLPDGQMGNSEVGHTNIGAGRVVYQELTRITKSIRRRFFETRPCAAPCAAKENGKALHLMGLLSDGGVHSHNEHLCTVCWSWPNAPASPKCTCMLSWTAATCRPTPARGFIEELLAKMNEIGVGKIATITGRYYAMDRDNRWDRVEKPTAPLSTARA